MAADASRYRDHQPRPRRDLRQSCTHGCSLSHSGCRSLAPAAQPERSFRACACTHHRLFSHTARIRPSDDPRPATPQVAPWSQRELLIQQVNRQRRQERWQQVQELFLKTGASDRDLAWQLNIDHRTVKKFRTADVHPEASRASASLRWTAMQATWINVSTKAAAVQQDCGASCARKAFGDK